MTKHGGICIPRLLSSIFCSYHQTFSIFAQKIHPPQDFIISCVSEQQLAPAASAPSPQLFQPKKSYHCLCLSYSGFNLGTSSQDPQFSELSSSLTTWQGEHVIQSHFPCGTYRVRMGIQKVRLLVKRWDLTLELSPRGTKLTATLLTKRMNNS